MGGNKDPWNDLDKWFDSRMSARDAEKRPKDWSEDASSSVKSPFERFKGFVDSNLGLLSEGLRKLPANIAELRAQMQAEHEARLKEEVEIWRDWTGSDDSPDHIQMQIERESSEARRSAAQTAEFLTLRAQAQNHGVPINKIRRLYRDHEGSAFGSLDRFATPALSNGGACYYMSETVDNLPSTARLGRLHERWLWLSVDWFKRSAYSPVRAEAHVSGVNLRAAFEDLLCATLDKPMVSTERVGVRPYGRPVSTYRGPGLDWMLSLQCRGILPPQLPSYYQQAWKQSSDRLFSSQVNRRDMCYQADIQQLAREISIRSTPDFDAAPLEADTQFTNRVPTTELELYDQMLPKTIPEGPWQPAMLGDRSEDREEADDALWDALASKDTEAAAECLEAYYHAHGDLHDLLEDPYEVFERETEYSPASPWFPVLNQALRQSKIPDDEHYKARALDPQSAIEEVRDRRSPEEKQRHRELVHPYETFAHNLTGSMTSTLEELEAVVKRIETEAAERERNKTSTGKHEISTTAAWQTKPDILSQLTTTQTTRLPDGTITTKMVMKQRFADGREECHESVQTTHDQNKERQIVQEKKASEKEAKQQEKKTGWFWS